MVTVEEARQIVLANCSTLDAVEIPAEQSVGYALSSAIISTIHIPAFRQSSMDGYAIMLQDKDRELPVQDELPAGTPKQIMLQPHTAVKVFTGGPVPDGADVVVQKELVTVLGRSIKINALAIELGTNIRVPGSEISKGEIAIPKGTVIRPMHIGYLASLGVTKVPVVSKPSVAIVITGNELVQPGEALQAGQVYESNSFGLKACLLQAHVSVINISYAKDNLPETEQKITQALAQHDLVLITGGVSVGDHDHVVAACLKAGIKQQFHGVKQKPGKPLFFGTKGKQMVFGLPGNPASVLSCFYQYVLPAIHCMSGMTPPATCKAKLKEQFEKKIPLTFFLKGFYENGTVAILTAQASFQLSAFVQANCWIELDETATHFEKDQEVKVHMFA